MLSSFERGERKLDDAKDSLALEMMGHQARLGNSEYLHNLDMSSKQLGLENETKFREEMARTVIGDDLAFLNDDLAHRRLMGGNDRQFQEEMASMDIDFATKMADQEIKASNERAKMEGVGGLITGGVAAGSAYAQHQSNQKEAYLDVKHSEPGSTQRRRAVETEASPVRPPACTPAALST